VKILHVIASMAANTGGPPRVVAQLSYAQACRGAEVHVASFHGDEPQAMLGDAGLSRPPVDNLKFSLLGNGSVLGNGSELGRLIDRSDIVHVHGVWELALQNALRAARRRRKGTVITPHGMISHYGMQKKSLKKMLGLRIYAKGSLERASFVHALTGTEAREIGYYAPRANICVVPNGVSPGEFAAPPGRDVIDRRFPELANVGYVLFLARLDHMKGIDVLIEAFAAVVECRPAVRLVVAGPDYGFGTISNELAKRLGIERQVHFVGAVHGEEKRALLAHALCVAQPSRHEGFSITLLEALASGTPLVVSDHVDLPGLLEERAGRIVPLQPRAIADAILQYASSDEPREALRARARRLVEERYTWNEVAKQLASECARHVAASF
jgi:glycosyltransferase involved in cell wall biosynthesis